MEYDDIVEFVIQILGSIEMIRFIFECLCESWNRRSYFLKIYKRVYHKKQKDSLFQFFTLQSLNKLIGDKAVEKIEK